MKEIKSAIELLHTHFSGNELLFKENKIEDRTPLSSAICYVMDQYTDQNIDLVVNMLSKPLEQLKPLEDLYRKENPREDGKFYIPDATAFYKWITNKILQNENTKREN